MKILAINASPRGENSCTDRILFPLLEGMREAGAETETIYLANKKIHHCIGCFSCWLKTPGQCVFKDDMGVILEKLVAADLIIYGTPLYCFTMTVLLKNVLDRSIPLALPFMAINKEGLMFHPARYPGKPKKHFLVSPCGFPEFTHFDALVATMKKLASASENDEYLGEILRPSAEMMNIPSLQPDLIKYFALVKEAGKQLVEKNKIEPDIYTELRQAWISQKDFMTHANNYFQSVIEKIKD
ncbi:MAG: Flavodoxin-like protein fold protein [uncultured bacterium]|nr:MAG: Flavodoxin-like protein fold protein [uncultured bacterium]